ncbi:glycosyltransferase family 2 protein [Sediminicoccus sp. BL-A-41-H5]|uniref:glycosyltransferase family 2 protein n=1 Tax=Sediminicoccus sp. BL-A-41-H5 TaxID=3421106 RepID=UPI003D672154
MTRLSVIVPAWQAAATLAETLASVAAELTPADEVIVVDDGSTDATAEVARAALPSAKLLVQPNRVAAAALNLGIAAARGAWIASSDADDLWVPGRIAAQLAALAEAPRLAGIGGLMESFACPSLPADAPARRQLGLPPVPCLTTGALLLRRDALEAIGSYEETLRIGYNLDWMHRARAAGLAFETLPRVVLRRRIRLGSLSSRAGGSDAGYIEVARRAIARRRGRPPADKVPP